MEFPCAFNEEPLQRSHRLQLALAKTGIVAGAGLAPHNSWRECQPIPEEDAMPARKLSEAEIKTLLPRPRAGVLSTANSTASLREGFRHRFGNMTRVALVAEAMNIIRNGSTCGTKWSST